MNDKIRDYMRANKVPQWQVADKLQMSEMSLTRLLRYPLSPEREQQIMAAIDELKAADAERSQI